MKIIFILGKYNPGRCGISDYVDLLSKELIKNGHIVGIRSFDSLRELRQLARDLEEADLYSIQFAPYAFSKIGFAGNALRLLAKSLEAKSVQVTFHELWIGSYPSSPVKHTVIGWVQKREILKFVKLLNPSVAFGTNSAAIDRLKREGVYAQYLYLFGNIPYSPIPAGSTKECFRVAFFGTAYENFPYELLSVRLKRIKKLSKQKIELRIIGRQRDSIGLEKIRSMAQKHGFGISMTNELPPRKISNELQNCSIGVSTTPYDVLGKSGATAAMLEHGLTIYAYDDGDTPKENLFVFKPFKDQIFLINESSHVKKIVQFSQRPRKPFFDGVVHTANNMLKMRS